MYPFRKILTSNLYSEMHNKHEQQKRFRIKFYIDLTSLNKGDQSKYIAD